MERAMHAVLHGGDSMPKKSRRSAHVKAVNGKPTARKRHSEHADEDEPSGGSRRAIWSGSLGFGLLQIPVTVHPAVKPSGTALHQLDRRNHAPIHYKRVNEETGEEVAWDDIVKGYEVEKGRFVVVDDEDFERMAVRSTQQVDLHDFVRAEDILPPYFDTPYYLAPAGRSQKAYVLFREALRHKHLAAIGTFVLRTREHLCAVFPVGDALFLEILRFSDELRDTKGLGIPRAGTSEHASFSSKELQMAEKLIESMSSDWDPSRYHDTYKEALVALLEKNAKTGKLPAAPKHKPRPTNVVDLMGLLKKSLAATGTGGR